MAATGHSRVPPTSSHNTLLRPYHTSNPLHSNSFPTSLLYRPPRLSEGPHSICNASSHAPLAPHLPSSILTGPCDLPLKVICLKECGVYPTRRLGQQTQEARRCGCTAVCLSPSDIFLRGSCVVPELWNQWFPQLHNSAIHRQPLSRALTEAPLPRTPSIKSAPALPFPSTSSAVRACPLGSYFLNG